MHYVAGLVPVLLGNLGNPPLTQDRPCRADTQNAHQGDGPSVSAGSANATAAVVPLAGTPEVLLSELPDTVTIGSRARFIDSNISPEATAVLHAPQPWKLNMACCLIILGVVLATAAGCILGQQRRRSGLFGPLHGPILA